MTDMLCLLTISSSVIMALDANVPPQKANTTNLEIKCAVDDNDRKATVTLRNIGTGDLLVLASGPGIDYSLRMTDGKRQPVQYTEFGRQTQLPPPNDGKLHPLSFSTQDITIQPGEQRREEISLEDFFLIPAAGGAFVLKIGRKLRYEDENITRTLSCKPIMLHLSPIKKQN